MVDNNLPLIKGTLKEYNCVDPNEISNPTPVYPLEVDRYQSDCSVDSITGQQLDSRYVPTGGAITELDVQNESGVYRTLTEMPMYEYYAGRFFANKKGGKVYNMWTRPTISWMIDCEE